MKLRHAQILGLVLVALSVAVALTLYARLPNPVPTHWNLRGEPDGFTPKPWGAFLGTVILAGLWLVFLALPRIAPRGFTFDRFESVWGFLQVGILGFTFFVTTLALLSAAGAPVELGRAIPAGLGLLLLVTGNLLGKVTRNFFVGIRTPWTLASEEVWLRTHRLGGRLFVLAGAAIFVCALAGWGGFAPTIVAVTGAALVSVLYSYVIYRRLEGFPRGAANQRPPEV